METTHSHQQAAFENLTFARFASGFWKAGVPFRQTSSNVHFSNAASQTHLMVLKTTFSGNKMDESDPFADDDGVESIVDEEGDLFYAAEDEVAVLEVNEQEYRDIFG